MLGYSREEFLGKKLWEAGAFTDTDKCKAAFKELQAKGYIRYEDLPLKTKDGRLINVEFVSNVYPLQALLAFATSVKNVANKWGVRYVPAAAVIRTPQVVLAIIGLKESVAGRTSLL